MTPLPPATSSRTDDAPAGRNGATGRDVSLLDAASRRFVAVGIAKTTMEDIAREAGAGKATLYRYFPNKAAVVDALVRRENERFTRRLAKAVAQGEQASDQIEGAFVAALEFLRSHPMLNKSLREEPDVLLPYLTLRSGPMVQTGMRIFQEVIEEGVRSGEFRAVHPEWAAETLFRLLMSFFSLPQLSIRVDDPAQVRAYAHGLVTGTLMARGGRAAAKSA